MWATQQSVPKETTDRPALLIRFERPNWFAEQWRDRRDRFWLALILLLALALRLVRLGTWSFWHDEAHNLLMSESIVRTLQGDLVSNHPPLFTFLLYLWRNLGFAQNEWSARLLVVLLGLVSIFGIYVVTRRLIDTRTGLVAAFLLAVSPLHVFHSQDLKEYMMLPATAPFLVYYLVRAVDENRPRLWVLYGLWVAIACYSDLFAAPLLIALGLWFLFQLEGRRYLLWRWGLASAAGVALFIPQLGLMLHKAQNILVNAQDWWIPAPTRLSIAFYVKAIAFGYSDLKPHFKIALAAFCILAFVGLMVARRRNGRMALLLGLWFGVPVTIVFVASQVTESFFLIRAMLSYALAFYILAAVALAWMRPMPLRALLLTGVGVLMSFSLAERYQGRLPISQFPHRPGIHAAVESREASRFILDRWQDGDVLLHASPYTWLSFYWYGFRDKPQYTAGVSSRYLKNVLSGNPKQTERAEFQAWWPDYVQKVAQGSKRVWFVFSDWHREGLPGNPSDVWRWLDAHYTELQHARFQNAEVFLYGDEWEGQAVTELGRLEDDGAAATLLYRAGERHFRYPAERPDNGLVASPVEARRGALTLRFEDAADAEVEDWAPGRPGRTVGFSVTNSSDRAVRFRAECLGSDAMVELASLYETVPESDVWTVRPMHNPQGLPPSYDLPCGVAEVGAASDTALTGSINLPAGTYATVTHMVGWPNHPAQSRARVKLVAGERDLLDVSPTPPATGAWLWWNTASVEVGTGQDASKLRLSAEPAGGTLPNWADLGQLAFRRTRTGDVPPVAGTTVAVWPGDMSLEPGETRKWAVRIDADMSRLDVWVFETGEEGRGYRIGRGF